VGLAYLATGFYVVRTGEQAVVRRCGRALEGLRSPDLHFGFPYGIDKVTRLKPLEHKRVGVGMGLAERALGRRAEPVAAECLTGDRNLILVSAIVQYRIASARAYLFSVADIAALVRNAAAAELASVVSGMKVDDVLTVERIAIQDRVREAAQAALDGYGAGVEVTAVSLPSEGVAPPQEVAEAFRDVTSAREDRHRTVNEAKGEAQEIAAKARGEARRILAEAGGYAAEVVEKARGDAERFEKIAAQLPANRELTIKRLTLEAMEEVLPRLNKVILDKRNGNAFDLGLIEAKE
jgi:membrane protease subunit HflK